MCTLRLLWGSLALATLGAALPLSSCSRTGLLTQEPCANAGEYRNCHNDCGPGTQVCESGYWQACDVPPTELECTNSCGPGLAHCENGQKAECVVAPTNKTCTNTCGTGVMWCTDDTWGSCEVQHQERPCTNTCGVGIEACDNNTWGECTVEPRYDACFSACGTGVETCINNVKTACNAPLPLPPKLYATVRDFRADYVDFEGIGDVGNVPDRGAVAFSLGPDNLPVWGLPGASKTISGKASFDRWYRTDPLRRYNDETQIWMQLAESSTTPGLYAYTNTNFFPIDNQLFGNEGRAHNYHFTMSVNTEFIYTGGEVFTFEGDDDMWVFINRRLAIDLGGIHQSETASISLDAQAATFGITRGGRYRLDFFFAERHTVASDFTIRTTIADVGSCP